MICYDFNEDFEFVLVRTRTPNDVEALSTKDALAT